MSRLYLITGFLGAGKTTFLKQFMKQFSSERMHIIVNEFGKEGIDGELLSELGIALDEINNGSIFCSCRLDKFKNVLQQVLQEKPDVIIVEASGLSDPTNVKKILNQREKFPGLEYMGCVCLLDARQFPKVYETAVVVKKTDSGIRSAASEQEGSCKNRRDRADSKDSEGPSTGFAVAYDIIWHDGREVAAGDAKAKSGNRRTAVANCRCDFAKISSAHSRRDKIRNTFSFSEYAFSGYISNQGLCISGRHVVSGQCCRKYVVYRTV